MNDTNGFLHLLTLNSIVLQYDDFEDALSLYESIAGSYFRYFDGLIRKSVNLPQAVLMERLAYFKAFIGACTHNIGVIHLLRGEYAEAYSCFDRATSKRAECHGVGTTDHLVCNSAFLWRQSDRFVSLTFSLIRFPGILCQKGGLPDGYG